MAFSKITQCKQPPVVLKTRQKQSIRSVTLKWTLHCNLHCVRIGNNSRHSSLPSLSVYSYDKLDHTLPLWCACCSPTCSVGSPASSLKSTRNALVNRAPLEVATQRVNFAWGHASFRKFVARVWSQASQRWYWSSPPPAPRSCGIVLDLSGLLTGQ